MAQFSKFIGKDRLRVLLALRTTALVVPLVAVGVAVLAFFPRPSPTRQSRVPTSPPQQALAVAPVEAPRQKPAEKQQPKPPAEPPESELQKPLLTQEPKPKSAEQPKPQPPKPQPVEVTNSLGMKLVLIQPGEFLMGSPDSDAESISHEKPQHSVRLTNPFYLGVYEVTQAQYQQVVGSNPSQFKGESLPVETVSWEDAAAFCKRLSEVAEERAAGRAYRLPTEAEWEYACRAGSTSKYSYGDSESELEKYAWYRKNAGNTTHPVGKKQANAWGLYDMQGNVWEWCADWYGAYEAGPASDPLGPGPDLDRVRRGGSWNDSARYCRSANRSWFEPAFRNISQGFRAVLSPSGF